MEIGGRQKLQFRRKKEGKRNGESLRRDRGRGKAGIKAMKDGRVLGRSRGEIVEGMVVMVKEVGTKRENGGRIFEALC